MGPVSHDGSNHLGPVIVLLDGLELMGQVQAFREGVLLGLEDLLPEVLVKSGQKQLMFNEFALSLRPSFSMPAWAALPAALMARMVLGLLSYNFL